MEVVVDVSDLETLQALEIPTDLFPKYFQHPVLVNQTWLCNPVLKTDNHHDLCRFSPRVRKISAKVSVSDLALIRYPPVPRRSLITPDKIEPLALAGASIVEVVVIQSTAAPYQANLIEQEVKTILRRFRLCSNCVIDLNGTRLGMASSFERLIVSIKNEDESLAFEVIEATKIVITRVEAMDRIRAAQKLGLISVAGLDSELKVMEKYMSKLRSGPIGSGILVSGPSGSGKSSLIAMACQKQGFHLQAVNCGDVIRSEVEQTQLGLEAVLVKAKANCKSGYTCLVLDNIDTLGIKREGAKAHERRTFSTLTRFLDEATKLDKLLVIGVTSNPQCLDPSLKGPQRLRIEVSLGIPTLMQRKAILQQKLPKGVSFAKDLSLTVMAEQTPGYLGSDLDLLVSHLNVNVITRDDLAFAQAAVPPSAFKSGLGTMEVEPVSWEDIGGLEDVKLQLKRALQWPLKHAEAFSRLDIRKSKGCLLYGPPGCGKTKLVRAAASEAGVVFLSASAASIFSPYVGDSEKAISELFRRARQASPSILFIDEIDALVSNRDGKKSGVQEKVLSTLLNEMDGIGIRIQPLGGSDSHQMQMEASPTTDKAPPSAGSVQHSSSEVLVVCATNRPDTLDPALVRPGRLDQLIYVPPPAKTGRVAILEHYTSKMSLGSDVSLDHVAERTARFSGADLENLCREAAILAMTQRGLDTDQVVMEDFIAVLSKQSPSISKKSLEQFEELSLHL